ncbi:hypothetical protein M9H77_26187 [Catharanthus roseus]|uniref:Uncharacterized protein n=1 Tax=Catharanthus roseus TaxID=4058 RepID=A0ACC0A9U9_CATRO|nr:hypothetical protein M9H77_26187 [Catharanthus roseus]
MQGIFQQKLLHIKVNRFHMLDPFVKWAINNPEWPLLWVPCSRCQKKNHDEVVVKGNKRVEILGNADMVKERGREAEMVEDNGEDGSIRKPADTFCNRKEVVEEDVGKGPDNALYDNCCMITAIKEIHRSLNDEQVNAVKEFGFGELVKIKPFEISKDIVPWVVNNFDCERWCLNVHGKIVFVDEKGMESMLGIKILYMEHLYPVGERMLPEISRNVTRVLNRDKNRVLSQEDELRDITDDIREEEGRRQKNSNMQCENEEKFCFGNSRKRNEEDDELGGDVNDEIGIAGLLQDIKTGFEKQSSESSVEFNGAGVAGVPTAHENDRKQATSLRPLNLNKIRETKSANILMRLVSVEQPSKWVEGEVINCFVRMLLSRARQVEDGKDIPNRYLPSWFHMLTPIPKKRGMVNEVRCMLQEAMKDELKRQHKLYIDSFLIEECIICAQQLNTHDCGVYVLHLGCLEV